MKERESERVRRKMCATEKVSCIISAEYFKYWRIVTLNWPTLSRQFFHSTSLIWFVDYVIGTYKKNYKQTSIFELSELFFKFKINNNFYLGLYIIGKSSHFGESKCDYVVNHEKKRKE